MTSESLEIETQEDRGQKYQKTKKTSSCKWKTIDFEDRKQLGERENKSGTLEKAAISSTAARANWEV